MDEADFANAGREIIAHLHIQHYFHQLANGAVVDVECLFGETKIPKTFERFDRL